MNIKQYLEAKYGIGQATTMLFCEAKVFGISYPLPNGWLKKFGDVEITACVSKKLHEQLNKSKKDSAQIGLRVLANAYLSLTTVPDAKSNSFLVSKAWKRIRLVALKKHGNKCQCCGMGVADGAVLNVDHIKPRRLHPELALHIDNLQVLCGDCNEGKGNWDMTDFRIAKG